MHAIFRKLNIRIRHFFAPLKGTLILLDCKTIKRELQSVALDKRMLSDAVHPFVQQTES